MTPVVPTGDVRPARKLFSIEENGRSARTERFAFPIACATMRNPRRSAIRSACRMPGSLLESTGGSVLVPSPNYYSGQRQYPPPQQNYNSNQRAYPPPQRNYDPNQQQYPQPQRYNR